VEALRNEVLASCLNEASCLSVNAIPGCIDQGIRASQHGKNIVAIDHFDVSSFTAK
jgi:hypothetical protein